MNQDLTVGKSSSVLWRFCLPLFGSIIFQQLYNIADSFVAGKWIGEDALAAVGNSYEITLIFIAFAFGCNVGCSVVVSQLFGGRRFAEMKTAVYTTCLAGGVLCLALMGGGVLCSAQLLRLIHTPENVLADSALYLDIYVFGLPFVFFYNIATGIFSAMGDSRTPFLFLACSSLSNIAVDILFVTAFRMGVAGVAWATFLCQGVSCILALVFVWRRLGKIEAGARPAVFSWRLLQKIAAVAVPTILQQSFVSVGNIIIQSVINTFGSAVMAGYSAAIKLNNLVITSLTTVSNGISNFSAQNLGAGKLGRIREGFTAGLKLTGGMAVSFSALYLLLGRPLMRLFLNGPAGEAMDTGLWILRILTPFYIVLASKLAADGVLKGTARMKPFMAATFADLFLRVGLAKALAGPFGTVGIWSAWPIGWIVGAAISLYSYRSDTWNKAGEGT